MPRRRRALTSEMARILRQRGHNDAREFAMAIGMDSYRNDPLAKKDVIDPSGDSHSVKSGQGKWQVFLYSRRRFILDDQWRVMNGIGNLIITCIDSFPPTYEEYAKNKSEAKARLRSPMVQLAEKLKDPARLRAFLNKSLFNGGEVNYLTVKHDGLFHVFLNKDVINTLGENIGVDNSRARTISHTPEQKVVFKYRGINLGELEMRNESPGHYREVRFNMIKRVVMELLSKIPITSRYNELVLVHGGASKRFGRWER
jgi:hypothetical protein